MLDLNYVRENLDTVRVALEKRGMPTAVLDDFAREDTERRRQIKASDEYNAQVNIASLEIGALMKEGKVEEAEARRQQVRDWKILIQASAVSRPEIDKYIRKLLEQ